MSWRNYAAIPWRLLIDEFRITVSDDEGCVVLVVESDGTAARDLAHAELIVLSVNSFQQSSTLLHRAASVFAGGALTSEMVALQRDIERYLGTLPTDLQASGNSRECSAPAFTIEHEDGRREHVDAQQMGGA